MDTPMVAAARPEEIAQIADAIPPDASPSRRRSPPDRLPALRRRRLRHRRGPPHVRCGSVACPPDPSPDRQLVSRWNRRSRRRRIQAVSARCREVPIVDALFRHTIRIAAARRERIAAVRRYELGRFGRASDPASKPRSTVLLNDVGDLGCPTILKWSKGGAVSSPRWAHVCEGRVWAAAAARRASSSLRR
jgi:hypothetical protein